MSIKKTEPFPWSLSVRKGRTLLFALSPRINNKGSFFLERIDACPNSFQLTFEVAGDLFHGFEVFFGSESRKGSSPGTKPSPTSSVAGSPAVAVTASVAASEASASSSKPHGCSPRGSRRTKAHSPTGHGSSPQRSRSISCRHSLLLFSLGIDNDQPMKGPYPKQSLFLDLAIFVP